MLILVASVTALLFPIIVIFVADMCVGTSIFNNPDFWYGYMGYFGSVGLGAVALSQSHKVNKTNEKLMEMQQEQQSLQVNEKASLITLSPVIIDEKENTYVVNDADYPEEFDVLNQKYQYFGFGSYSGCAREKRQFSNLVLEVENLSQIPLKELHINNLRVFCIITNESGLPEEEQIEREYWYIDDASPSDGRFLSPLGKNKLCLTIGMDKYDLTKESFKLGFDITAISVYGVAFSQSVVLFRNNVIDMHDHMYIQLMESRFELVSEKGVGDTVKDERPGCMRSKKKNTSIVVVGIFFVLLSLLPECLKCDVIFEFPKTAGAIGSLFVALGLEEWIKNTYQKGCLGRFSTKGMIVIAVIPTLVFIAIEIYGTEWLQSIINVAYSIMLSLWIVVLDLWTVKEKSCG